MKNLLIILALLISEVASAATDTLKVVTKVTEVTVFFSGAQVTHAGEFRAPRGRHVVLLERLPNEIMPESIQVEGMAGCTILSVKFRQGFTETEGQDSEARKIRSKVDSVEMKIKAISNKMNVFDIEEKLLSDNSVMHKKEQGTSVAEIREAADFYRVRLNEIRQGKLNLEADLKTLNEKLRDLNERLNRILRETQKSYGKVQVTVDCQKDIATSLKMSCFVPSAGWSPSYDFRVEDVTKPLVIVYNANVFQSTGEDWKNVTVRLSSGNPSLAGSKPELAPWYLGRVPSGNPEPAPGGTSALKGRVSDAATGEPIAFANVVIERNGVQINGATTDFDGHYAIKPVPSGPCTVKVNFVGYEGAIMNNVPLWPGRITFQDFRLKPSATTLQEIQVVEYKTPLIAKRQATAGGTTGEVTPEIPSEMTGTDNAVVTTDYISNTRKTNVANLEYQIDLPYTIPSDGSDYTIRIKEASLPVNYVYDVVPKLDKSAFLTAEIPGWTQLNLVSGKAGIYYQGTYTGESLIDDGETSDTLRVSLGRDRNIVVRRDGNKEVNDKRVIGSNVRETVGWDITLRNNKNCPVRITVRDQFPVSEKKSIEVERLESAGAKVDDQTGQVTWNLELQPDEKKTLTLKFSVKYPVGSFVKVE